MPIYVQPVFRKAWELLADPNACHHITQHLLRSLKNSSTAYEAAAVFSGDLIRSASSERAAWPSAANIAAAYTRAPIDSQIVIRLPQEMREASCGDQVTTYNLSDFTA